MSSNNKEECGPGSVSTCGCQLAAYQKNPGLAPGQVAPTNQPVTHWLCGLHGAGQPLAQTNTPFSARVPFSSVPGHRPSGLLKGRCTLKDTPPLAPGHLQKQEGTLNPIISPAYLSAPGLPALLWPLCPWPLAGSTFRTPLSGHSSLTQGLCLPEMSVLTMGLCHELGVQSGMG